MQKVSRFRGMAGEVMYQFMLPKTLISALPILIIFSMLWLVTTMIEDLTGYSALPAFFIVYVMMVGHFSLPALKGVFDSNFLSGTDTGNKLWLFTLRYMALILGCALPLALFASLTVGLKSLPGSAAEILVPLASIQQSSDRLPLTAIVLVSMLMLTLFLIVATRARTLREAFSLDMWAWLLSERRADLPIFYVALTGGLVIFFGIYLIPFALVFFLAFKFSIQLGVAVSAFFYLWVLAATPILVGRMCGAFVAGENDLDFATENILALLGVVPSTASPQMELKLTTGADQPQPIEKKLSFNEMVAKIRALPIDTLTSEISKTEALLATRPHDPYIAVELAMLYRRAGEAEKALKAAARAITKAINNGYAEIGVSLFRGFAKERADLGLDAQTLEIIGNILLKQELVLDAGWCLHESATLAGDMLKAQKKLMHVATVAEEAGRYTEAIALYNFFISAYPHTNLVQYAKQGKNRAEAAKD
jgi:tetratricopeptide (TPR) repeat protein